MSPHDGKRVALFGIDYQRHWKGYEYRIRLVIERSINKHGQQLLIPDISLEGWWTSLSIDKEGIIQLYADHGTSEQFHSEFKTDLDIERLPSGKFATNALVLGSSVLAYNILRWIGQNGLLGPKFPKRHPAKGRRIKTAMQELMYVAARIIQTAHTIKLSFGKGCRSIEAYRQVFN